MDRLAKPHETFRAIRRSKGAKELRLAQCPIKRRHAGRSRQEAARTQRLQVADSAAAHVGSVLLHRIVSRGLALVDGLHPVTLPSFGDGCPGPLGGLIVSCMAKMATLANCRGVHLQRTGGRLIRDGDPMPAGPVTDRPRSATDRSANGDEKGKSKNWPPTCQVARRGRQFVPGLPFQTIAASTARRRARASARAPRQDLIPQTSIGRSRRVFWTPVPSRVCC